MSAARSLAAIAITAAAIAWGGSGQAIAANDPAALDAPISPVAPSTVDIRVDDPAPRAATPSRAPREAREPRGNPLWAIPLSTLSATRERPLFLPSRRPPVPPAVAGPPVVVAAAKPVEDQRLLLTLVGAVAGESEGFAIFIDMRDNAMVRLRTGQEHAGWTLNGVKGREVTFAKDKETAVFALPAPGTNGTPSVTPHAPGLAAVPEAVAAAAARHGAAQQAGVPMVMPNNPSDFAPYTPRSAPKNGESDGL
jgi:general secretion pathway protein N